MVGVSPDIRAAEFVLPDHLGRQFRSETALHRGSLLVVFIRGHWCPYCRRYLAKLQSHLESFRQRGATLVAISPESSAASAALVARLGLEFPILSDIDGRAMDQFGVRNRFLSDPGMLPHPAVLIIDGAGRVRFRSIDRDIRRRTTMRAILGALDAAAASSE